MPFEQSVPIDFSALLGFVAQFLSSAMALVGVFVGAYIANKAAIRQQYLNSLRTSYANVFRYYSAWVQSRDTAHLAELIPAIYEARLLSGPEVDASLQFLSEAVTVSNPSPDICSQCLQEFWNGAQKEIRKGYGK